MRSAAWSAIAPSKGDTTAIIAVEKATMKLHIEAPGMIHSPQGRNIVVPVEPPATVLAKYNGKITASTVVAKAEFAKS